MPWTGYIFGGVKKITAFATYAINDFSNRYDFSGVDVCLKWTPTNAVF